MYKTVRLLHSAELPRINAHAAHFLLRAFAVELLEELLHLLVLIEQPVDILNLLTAARRYTLFAGGVDDVGIFPLTRGH